MDCFLVDENEYETSLTVNNSVARQIGTLVEDGGYKHSHIHYKGLLIENHKYLINFNKTKQGIKIEKIMQQWMIEVKCKMFEDSNLWIPRLSLKCSSC